MVPSTFHFGAENCDEGMIMDISCQAFIPLVRGNIDKIDVGC
jgi:hypothetical protein